MKAGPFLVCNSEINYVKSISQLFRLNSRGGLKTTISGSLITSRYPR